MSLLDWPTTDLHNEVTVLENVIHSQEIYLNVLFPSNYRYYFELVQDSQNPLLIEHPFRLYFPQAILVEWVPPNGTNGIYITLESSPAFMPFGPLTVQIYLPQVVYDAIVNAMINPINSPADLVPPPEGNTIGEVEFVLLSTDAGEQIKIDLVNTSYTPEIPVTVKTLQWNEVLYYVMNLPPLDLLPPLPPPSTLLPPPPTSSSLRMASWGSRVWNTVPWNGTIPTSGGTTPPVSPPATGSLSFEFVYTVSGDLGITLMDPRYPFLREWITFPVDWADAIKDFAGV